MKTLLFGLLSFCLQPSWASQFEWKLSIGEEVKVVGDEQMTIPAGDWTCVLSKNAGIDKKEIRQLECRLGDEGKTQLTGACGDRATYDLSNVTLPQKKGGGITVGLACYTKQIAGK